MKLSVVRISTAQTALAEKSFRRLDKDKIPCHSNWETRSDYQNTAAALGPPQGGDIMAYIRYLAFVCNDASTLANFYKDHFSLEEISRSADGDLVLTDGFYKFSFFQMRDSLALPRMTNCAHHVGVAVDSIAETVDRYRQFNPRGVVVEETGSEQFGQVRIFDPECNPVILCENSFGLGVGTDRLPRMRHIAFGALIPEGMFNFYAEVFGLREVRTSYKWREIGKQNRFMGDGRTNIAIHPFYNGTYGYEARYGINHFGFLLGELENTVARLSTVVPIAPRPERPYEDYRVRDLEGNGIDLSYTKGFEVDIDKWDIPPGR
jgi:catechol 2,3-dioxygenase-like lactoylglutathione lyase family enzyme